MTARRWLPRKISVAVLDNLRQSLVPLIYSSIAPSSYVVYLHPDDYAGIEGIVPALTAQIDRALNETTEILNHPRWWNQVLHLAQDRLPPIEPITLRTIEILPDPNEQVAEGEVAVHSELRLPSMGEYAGVPTVRVTMTTTAGAPPRREDVPLATPGPPGREVARLTIDDLEGRREHELVDNPTLVGRGGLGCYVHVRLRADGQVSKEHCRIRRDESGEFFIKDLSRNGTSLNGQRLPPGVEFIDGQKREVDGNEVPLPHGARIALADVLHLEFRRET